MSAITVERSAGNRLSLGWISHPHRLHHQTLAASAVPVSCLIVFTLVQPAIWLLLFGQLFKGVVALPGLERSSYIAFLTPGIVMMTALMTSGWNGTTFIADMERGVMDRMLTSPVTPRRPDGRPANQ